MTTGLGWRRASPPLGRRRSRPRASAFLVQIRSFCRPHRSPIPLRPHGFVRTSSCRSLTWSGLNSQTMCAENLGCWMRTTSAAAAFSAVSRPRVRRWAMISQVIDVPSPLGLRPSGLEDAPDALRRAGLHERLGSPDAGRIDVPPYDNLSDPETGVLNPQGIAAVARDVARAVDATLDAGRFPVLLGGDCSIVLGPLLALRRRGRYGLAFLDGHADFQHPSDEPNGEVASLDLAVATGRGPELLTNLDGLRPLVRDEDVALVGYRVLDDNDHFLGEHIRSTAITVVDLSEVRAQGTRH